MKKPECSGFFVMFVYMETGDTIYNTNNGYKGYIRYKSPYAGCIIMMFPNNNKAIRTIELPYIHCKIVLIEKHRYDFELI